LNYFQEEKKMQGVWVLVVLIIINILFPGRLARAEEGEEKGSAIFTVRHVLNDDDREQIVAYAGHPSRARSFTLLFAVPKSTGIRMNGYNATDIDLPGQFAALYLNPNDPLSMPYTNMMTSTDESSSSVINLPEIQLKTHNTLISFSLNITSMLMDLPVQGSLTQGALYVGPGSSIYSRWRYADYTRRHFTLSQTRTVRKNEKQLQCETFDQHNRCVLSVAPGSVVRVYSDGRNEAILEITRVVLDFTSSASAMPPQLYGALRKSQETTEFTVNNVMEYGWNGHLFATYKDVSSGGGSSMGMYGGATDDRGIALTTTPKFVVTENTDSLVLGRHTLTQLFRTWTYDSSTASFTVVFNDQELSEVIRATLALTSLLQALLLANYVMSPFNLSIRNVMLTPVPQRRTIFETSTSIVIREAMALILATIQAIVGLLYVGDGFGVDYDLAYWLYTFDAVALGIILWQFVMWIFFVALTWKRTDLTRGRLVTDTYRHALHASAVGLGIMVAYTPSGVISMIPLLTSNLIGIGLVIPCLFYNVVMVIMFAAFELADWSDRYFRWTLLSALFSLGILGVISYMWAAYIMIPVIGAWNIRFGVDEEPLLAYMFVAVAFIAVLWLVLGEAQAIFRRYVTIFEDNMKDI
jgi:hypothetical protein